MVENPLSKDILAMKFDKGDKILIDANDENITFSKM